MTEFIPLSERPSTELKMLDRAVRSSIEMSLPIPPDADREYRIILGELTTLDYLIKSELAARWEFCRDRPSNNQPIN